MIAFEVRLNGKRICIAGDEDLSVLNAIITACGPLGPKTVPARPGEPSEIFYSVGGLTSRPNPDTDVYVRWKSVAPLKVGDVIHVKVLDVNKTDRAKNDARRWLASCHETPLSSHNYFPIPP